MKKKILSLVLACLMIMTAIIAILPASATSQGSNATAGAPTNHALTAKEQEMKTAGYTCYVTGGSIGATTTYTTYDNKTVTTVLLDDGTTYALPFYWLTDCQAKNGALVYGGTNVESNKDCAVVYIFKNSSVNTSYKIALLDDVAVMAKAASGNSGNWRHANGGTVFYPKNYKISEFDGNGYTYSASVGFIFYSGGSMTLRNINMELTAIGADVKESFAIIRGNTNVYFEDCTFNANMTLARDYGMFRIDSQGSTTTTETTLSLDGCVVNADILGTTYMFVSAIKAAKLIISDSIFNCTQKSGSELNGFFIYSTGGQTGNRLAMSNTTVNASGNMGFMVVNLCDNHSITLDNSTINVGGEGFTKINGGQITLSGNTTFNCGDTAIHWNEGKDSNGTIYAWSASRYFMVKDTATITAPTLSKIVVKNGQCNPGNIISENPTFFHDSTNDVDMYTAPTLLDGASVRTTADTNGLRFTATADLNNASNKTLGMLVAKTSVLEGKEFTIDGIKDLAGTANVNATEENKVVENDDSCTYSVALCGMKEENLNTMYSARAYAIYNMNFATITVYSDYDEDNVRSLAWVADMASKDLKTAKDDSSGYIFEVETGKFSPYSKEQYDVVKAYAAKYVAPVNN